MFGFVVGEPLQKNTIEHPFRLRICEVGIPKERGAKQMEERHGVKVAIVVLAILLGLSFLGLACIHICKPILSGSSDSVAIPDNLIELQKDISSHIENENEVLPAKYDCSAKDLYIVKHANASAAHLVSADAKQAAKELNVSEEHTATLELHSKNTSDNAAFNVGNMFPGDSITKTYCVEVSHKGDVEVHFKADLGEEGHKLGKALKIKVKLIGDNDEVLYNGSIANMQKSVVTRAVSKSTIKTTASKAKTTSKMLFTITAYLEPEAGNEYQDINMDAKFTWWVEDTENLEPPPPRSGDVITVVLLACIAICLSSAAVLFVIKRTRRKDSKNA